MAGPNVGKSLFLCHCAASSIRQGKNVLYITLEMSEQRIAERIDCNLMDCTIDELAKMQKNEYLNKVKSLESLSHGKLIIKEYPTASAHAGHFRLLLDELRMKKNFIPDIIFIDYINICASQRYKSGASFNSYFLIKSISEELRGIAIEFNVPIVSATQTTRSGFQNSEVEMSDVAEGFSLAMTADFMFAIIRSEELDNMNQLMIKQLKSRFNDVNYYRKFVIGVDIFKFKLFDVASSANAELVGSGRKDDSDPPKLKFLQSNKQYNWKEIDIDFS